MSRMFADVQPAVKKETRKVAIGTLICVALMWAVFGIGHAVVPEKIPFDYTVFLAGAIGGIIAVLNFFLMGLTVQKVVSMEDDKQAAMRNESQLYPENDVSDCLGNPCDCSSVLSVCSRTSSTAFSKYCNQSCGNSWQETDSVSVM